MAATLAFITSPLWSQEFAGFRPDQFPIPQDRPPIQPAGYAFSIWGLIYLWLFAHALIGLLKPDAGPGWDAMRPPLIVSLGVGAFWIPMAGVSPVWATVLIWIMLLSALAAVARSPAEHHWLARAPVALYAGWLTGASFVSIGLVGAGYGIGPGAAGWAYIALAGALAFALAAQTTLPRAPAYGAAVIWALAAILLRNLADGGALGVAILAGLGIAALAFLTLRRELGHRDG